ncbi:hypothetical protein [Paenibacillus sp. 1A_MP2]|uniref:hypothetical protein n=1 Tax=Paenibacillus sp. 1A_MP2 TaxID=3457495 RepID=UPI003FCD70B4
MKLTKEIGISLGFLAGTTFGSGIAFCFAFKRMKSWPVLRSSVLLERSQDYMCNN